MAAGLQAYKEDGSQLFDTEKITYGLLKSGYLSLQTSWPRLLLKSGQLDPNDGGNWTEDTSRMEPVLGFSVTGAVAPIVFISGDGCPAGSSRSGGTTTFYFVGCSTTTKYYYFDTMRDTLSGAGLKTFRESDGVLTFNSLQYPLNIVAAVQPPAPGTPYTPGYWTSPYNGGVTTNGALISGAPANIVSRVTVPISAGEFAAAITFTRGCGIWGSNYYPYTVAASEGAGGVSGGVRFMFSVATRTTQLAGNATANLYFDIPSVRPTALIIRTENLPFPFN